MKHPKPGRPAPLGRKEKCCIRLTPDVAKFCREFGFSVLEDALRETKAFKQWLTKNSRSGQNGG